jgi:hypothetical protein
VNHYDRRILDDDELLLAQCKLATFRGPGPGGQKRNKTSSAVRLTHVSTGIAATAGESRSQAQNRRMALERLRMNLVLSQRTPLSTVPSIRRQLDAVLDGVAFPVGKSNPRHCQVLAFVLDLLAMHDFSISACAQDLGITTGALAKFLLDDSRVRGYVNQNRQALGLRKLVGS